MSAHFDGGAEIAGRRLREVEVSYVDDPTLDMGAEDSDDCPASPPPTYYLRVREENTRRSTGGGSGGNRDDDAESNGGRAEQEQGEGGAKGEDDTDKDANNNNNNNNNNSLDRGARKKKRAKDKGGKKAWAWRYVNVEKKKLLVWDRRGGRLLRSISLRDIESLLVIPDEGAPASILEVYISSPSNSGGASNGTVTGDGSENSPIEGAGDEGEEEAQRARRRRQQESGEGESAGGGVLVLQARSRRETLLWAKVLQENVELMTKRQVPLENRDEETSLSDVQQLAKLLTHQLSELQDSGINNSKNDNNKQSNNNQSDSKVNTSSPEAPKHRLGLFGADSSIPEGADYGTTPES
ncbi:unnamed protein product [Ectocarpus sp. CCAP 1310/34]|nr:unnamed protein product [Ectocarpus sp. CCAP 1310/34]